MVFIIIIIILNLNISVQNGANSSPGKDEY